MQPHPLFAYGPLLFVALSFAASVPLAPLALRRATRWQVRRSPFGPPNPRLLRVACLAATTILLWATATAIGGVLLMIPADAPADGVSLPGQRVDAALVAHAVPPLSEVAAERLVADLTAPGGPSRWEPPGDLERRLVLAGRIDPDPGRAVSRLADAGYRTRAGALATARPSAATCDAGLRALAEALRGGALSQLMVACRNAPGDGVGRAALVVGDFMRAVGGEAESIVSRQPLAPAAEPRCFAGGLEVPARDMPICRLVHAEHVPGARDEVLADAAVGLPAFAARWADAMRAERGEPLGARWGAVDPAALVATPRRAVLDEPVAVLEDLLVRGRADAAPRDRAWMLLAAAAGRSAAGRHERARGFVDDAMRVLDAAPGLEEEARREAARLAVAIAIRRGDGLEADTLAAELDDGDPLRADVAWLLGERAVHASWPAWTSAVADGVGGAALAAALARDPRATEGLVRLRAVPAEDRAVIREWLREAFPPCDGCGFFDRLAHHEARLDAARALDDDELVAVLEPIVARFEAVVLHRGLALSLRAAHGEGGESPRSR